MKDRTRRRLKWWRDYLFWLVVLPVWVPTEIVCKLWAWIWRKTRRFAE